MKLKMQFIVRKGNKADLPAVLALIKELAVYEKAPLEVTLTLEELERDGFGEKPVYSLFVAESRGEIIGMALYYLKYSTWKGTCIFLEDIIVKEQYRGYKVGLKLFEAIVRVSKEMNVPRMEWQVLDWNEPAINFYKKFNSYLDDGWINCKLVHAQIQAFEFSED